MEDPKYSPETLEQCYEILDKELKEEDILAIKEMPYNKIITMHFGLGMWMRNNFGLWREGDTKLKTLFHKEHIEHPDDMSHHILTGYWHHVRGEPASLDILITEQNMEEVLT